MHTLALAARPRNALALDITQRCAVRTILTTGFGVTIGVIAMLEYRLAKRRL